MHALEIAQSRWCELSLIWSFLKFIYYEIFLSLQRMAYVACQMQGGADRTHETCVTQMGYLWYHIIECASYDIGMDQQLRFEQISSEFCYCFRFFWFLIISYHFLSQLRLSQCSIGFQLSSTMEKLQQTRTPALHHQSEMLSADWSTTQTQRATKFCDINDIMNKSIEGFSCF